MSDPFIEHLLTGDRHRIYYICEGSHETFRDLVEKLHATGPLAARLRKLPRVSGKKDSPTEWKKLWALMQRAALHGLPTVRRNKTKCKCFTPPEAHTRNERIEVCEFKSPPYRVLFFEEEPSANEPCTTLIITHVFSKKQDETPPTELTRFADLRARYYQWRDGLGASDAITALARCNL